MARSSFVLVEREADGRDPLPFPLEIPRPGVTTITGPIGSGKSKFLRDLLRAQRALPDLVAQVHEGVLRPTSTALHVRPLVRTAFVPARFHLPPSATIADLLGIPQALKALTQKSYTLRCPVCGQTVPIYRSMRDAALAIVEIFQGSTVTFLAAVGDRDERRALESLGFELSADAAHVLDTIDADAGHMSRMLESLALVRKFPTMKLSVTDGKATRTFGRTGICASCESVLPELEIRESMRSTADGVGGLLLAGDATLRELLEMPLVEFERQPIPEPLTYMKAFAQYPALGDVTLLSQLSELDAERADIVRLGCLEASFVEGSLVLIEAPHSAGGTIHLKKILHNFKGRAAFVVEDRSGELEKLSQRTYVLPGRAAEAPLEDRIATSAAPAGDVEAITVDCASPRLPRVAAVHEALFLTQAMLDRTAHSIESRTGFETEMLQSRRSARVLCRLCSGFGSTEDKESERFDPLFTACVQCQGAGVTEHGAFFIRNVPLEEVLKLPVSNVLSLLRAAVRPEKKALLRALGLGHLIISQPLQTLSDGERALLTVAHELVSTKKGVRLKLLNWSRMLPPALLDQLPQVRAGLKVERA